jgi:hypothetical protein
MWRGTWFDHNGAGYRGIIEASVTPIINAGTNSGTLTDGRTTQIYKFNGTAGQAFVLTPVTAPANTTWTVYSPSGEVLVNGNANEIQTLGVKADGVYTLAIRGNAQATANFAFTVSEIKEGGVTSPPATAINFNQVYSGSLSSGQTVRFTFTGTAGQNLFYDAQGGANVGLSLIDPFGRQVVSNANSTSDQRAGFTLTSDGVYTLVLGGVGAGTYRFQLMDLESGSNITLGNNFSGTFAAGGTSALAYRLEVTDTGFHYIDGQAGDGFVYVYRANGEQVAFVGSTNSDAEIWLEAGRYYLVYAGQGSANFTSKVLKSTVSHRGAISFYDQVNNTGVVSGTIANPTDQDVYTFTGQAGQILMFDALTSREGLAYQIYSPSGKLLRNQSWGGSWSPLGISVNVDSLPNENMLLTESGTYTIRVVSGYTSAYGLGTAVTGNYQFRLFDVSNAQTASLDSTISGTVTARGSHVYRFNNPTRQYIYVDGQAGSGSWYIYGQDGALVNSHQLIYDQQFWLDAGEYYLVVQGDTDSTNNYSLRIETPSLVDFPTISYGQIVSGTIDELGEQHYYRFEGRAGDKIYFDSLGSSNRYVTVWFGDKNFRTIITDSYGDLYSDRDYQPSGGLTLLEDGTYYMTVDGYFSGSSNDNLGSYNFRLLNLNNAPVVNLDELISGTFTHGGLSAHAYRFNLTQRQYVFVDGQAGHGDWRIYRADGTKVAEDRVTYNDQFWLDAGEYYLVVSGYAGGTNYSLQLVNTELRTITPAISFDTVVSDVISKKGQQHYYTFEGRAGQRLMFDGLGTTNNIFARITDPLGRLIMDDGGGWGVQTNADRFPNQGLTLEFDGVYTITIDGYDDRFTSSARTGAYSFRLLDLNTKPAVGFDVDISGTFDTSARGAEAYQFSLDRPTYLYFDAKGGDGSWDVYAQNGTHITGGRLWQDRELWLDAGNYSLVFAGAGSNANYALQISKPDLPTTAYTVGEVISGTIAKEGDQHYYRFNGKAGQVLYLDSQTKVNGFRVRITAPSGRSLIGDFDTFNKDDKDFIILSETGEYTLTVDPINEVMGDYRLRLVEYGDKATMPTQIVLNATNPTAQLVGHLRM